MSERLLYFVSHPIQYQAPLLRRIAKEPGIKLRVVFERLPDASGSFDPGFNRTLAWDVPLTEGYDHVSIDDTNMKEELRAADAIWCHGWQSPKMRQTLRHANALGVPVLMRGENCDLAMPDGRGVRGWLKRRYVRRIFGQCQAFLAIGAENRRYYERYGIPSSRIFPMPYAIDNELFAREAETSRRNRSLTRARFGLPGDGKIVLFAGKFLRRKHPEQVAEAARRLRSDLPKPALVFIGEGEMEAEVRAASPDALFLGFRNQTEMPGLYAAADLLVVPSEREPWGLVVNEAMACGTAAVVSDQVGCAADLIADDRGAVFPTGNIAALTNALERCLPLSESLGAVAADWIRGWGFDQDIQGLKRALEFTRTTRNARP